MEKVYATYTYDAWGKLIGITNYTGASILGKTNGTSLANLNPLRYRGYYYDNETGFYYLQSRYYDPTLKRFLNADAYVSTGQGFIGTNMFAYCNNCPVLFADPYGYDSGEAVASLTGWELLLLWLNESSAASTVIWCFAPMLLFTKAEPVVITKTAMPDAPDTTAPPDNSVSSAEEAEAATGAPLPPNRNRKKKKRTKSKTRRITKKSTETKPHESLLKNKALKVRKT